MDGRESSIRYYLPGEKSVAGSGRIVALIIVSFAVHFLFSPWLLVAVAVVAWIKFRPRRSQR